MKDDNTGFTFQIPEIDPDYVPQMETDTPPDPSRITSKGQWIKSLLFPVLSMLTSVFLFVMSLPGSGRPFIFTMLLGLICGGIVPTVMIVLGKLDTSKFFLGKMIILVSAVAVGALFNYTELEYWVWDILGVYGFQILFLSAELIFAAVQRTDIRIKLCIALSSLAWGFLGFAIDFSLLWH